MSHTQLGNRTISQSNQDTAAQAGDVQDGVLHDAGPQLTLRLVAEGKELEVKGPHQDESRVEMQRCWFLG